MAGSPRPPAHKRVSVFRAAVHQLSKLFAITLFPEDASVPLSHYGCLVQRQPIPGFHIRAEFPHRIQVNKFIRATLASMRSKSTVMHLVLQPPQPVDSFPQLVDTSEMASPICKPQWAWLEDGSWNTYMAAPSSRAKRYAAVSGWLAPGPFRGRCF